MKLDSMSARPNLWNRLRKAVLGTAALILVCAAMLHGPLDNVYVTYSRNPDPENGRIVPYEVKGVVVYITKDQSELLTWLWRIEIVSGVIVLASLFSTLKWPLDLSKW